MKVWNGWGDDGSDLDYPLKPSGRRFLERTLGRSSATADATLEEVIARVPESRLPAHQLVSTDAEDRLRHARGQSLPDWLALRSGNFGAFPDGVAFPESGEQVRELLAFADRHDIVVIPYGGGTSVVGHINPEAGNGPVLTIDMGRMDQLMALDRESQVATFGAGTPGPLIESQLAAEGFCLGHYPQSWELSTLGGWVASRSSGQQSLRYGRIENMFAGGRIETPRGTLEIPTFPASSCGPDIRQMFLGSEGRMGIITEVKVRVTPLPERETFHVAFFRDWESGMQATREIVQQGAQLSMMRLSNETETATQLKLAGHEMAVSALNTYLGFRGAGRDKCMFTFGVTGSGAQCSSALKLARRIIARQKGIYTGTALGKKWEHSRFRAPYLRNGLWEAGYLVDTMETCVDWSRVADTARDVETEIGAALRADDEKVHVFTHLSHFYGQGASVYTTYVFRCADSQAESLERWRKLKTAGAEAIVRNGGTISHQHGVGKDHAPYLPAEKGALGIAAIRELCETFDPKGLMNPGKLVP